MGVPQISSILALRRDFVTLNGLAHVTKARAETPNTVLLDGPTKYGESENASLLFAPLKPPSMLCSSSSGIRQLLSISRDLGSG